MCLCVERKGTQFRLSVVMPIKYSQLGELSMNNLVWGVLLDSWVMNCCVWWLWWLWLAGWADEELRSYSHSLRLHSAHCCEDGKLFDESNLRLEWVLTAVHVENFLPKFPTWLPSIDDFRQMHRKWPEMIENSRKLWSMVQNSKNF
jgi:hypothetical protein